MVGLDGLKGLFQPTRFYDSMTIITFSCLHEQRIFFFFFKIAPESHVVLVKITEQQLLRIYIYTYGITVNI